MFIITIRGYVEQPTPGAPIQLNFFHPCRYPNSTLAKVRQTFNFGIASLLQRFHSWYNNPFHCYKSGNWNSETHKCSWPFFTKCFV